MRVLVWLTCVTCDAYALSIQNLNVSNFNIIMKNDCYCAELAQIIVCVRSRVYTVYQSVSMAEHSVCRGTGIRILSMSGVQFLVNGSAICILVSGT